MKKNRLLTTVLAIMVFATFAVMLVSCGDDYTPTYAWGKTFTFEGEMDYWNGSITEIDGVVGTSCDVLLKQEFDKGNLDLSNATINGEKIDLSSAKSGDELIAKMKDAALARFNLKLKGLTISVGTEESPTVTINEYTYDLVSYYEGSYAAVLPEGEEGCFEFYTQLSDNTNGIYFGKDCLSAYISDGLDSLTSIYIYIPTKTVIDDVSATENVDGDTGTVIETGITFSYTAYFGEVTE